MGGTTTSERQASCQTARGLRLLVADDDEAVRTLYATLLKEVAGVESVVAAADGAEAVELVESGDFDVAVLDLNMPRRDGLDAALAIKALRPRIAVALQSSDPDSLRRRADGLGLPLFDKVGFDRLVAWIAGTVATTAA